MAYNLKCILKKNLFLIVLIIIYITICFIIKSYFSNYIIKLDEIVRVTVINILSNYLTNSMKIITNLASFIGILSVFIIAILMFKKKNIKYALFFNVVLTGILSFLLKLIFSRLRPIDSLIKMPNSYSFPSGHTFFAVSFFGLIVYFIYKSNINKNIKVIVIPIIILLIVLIGFSRIYLGVHHFTDVIGGLLFGILILLISINTYKVMEENS